MAQLQSLSIGGQPVADFVFEKGTYEGTYTALNKSQTIRWYYKKWANGDVELWGTPQVNSSVTGTITELPLPSFCVSNTLCCNINIFSNANDVNTGNGKVFPIGWNVPAHKLTIKVFETAANPYVSIIIKTFWKDGADTAKN